MNHTHKFLLLAFVVNLNSRFAILLKNGERPVLNIALDILVVHLAANETFSVEDRILGVGVERILRAISDTEYTR
jgi:hypothetical protein